MFVAREVASADPAEDVSRALDDPAAVVLAGTVGTRVVGVALGRVQDLADASRLGRIQVMFVERGARGIGVGEALMNALLAWFTAEGCAGVDATALPGNREAKNFFEAAGFSARLLVMHHSIGPAAGPPASESRRQPPPEAADGR